MKLFDIKVANKDVYGKTHWRTIGTVFANDDGSLFKYHPTKKDENGNHISQPVGFCIDFPQAQGIIVPRLKKEQSDETSRSGASSEPELLI
jgi:hypothetical protein